MLVFKFTIKIMKSLIKKICSILGFLPSIALLNCYKVIEGIMPLWHLVWAIPMVVATFPLLVISIFGYKLNE